MKKLSIFLSFIFVFSLFTFNVGCSANKNARSSYYVEVSLDGTTLSGSETVEFYNSSESVIQELKFNLFANAFRKGAKYSPIAPQHTSRAYPNGINYGEMTITSVKSGSNALDFSICGQDENILSIELDAEIFPEERVRDFKFTAEQMEFYNSNKTIFKDYVNESLAKFGTGVWDPNSDADWNTYLTELEALGLSKYIETCQEGYTAFRETYLK